uniref:Uncharacterized protein n=1 Tax=Romanomermis culicivorax TaxID=13658 RepID=A0A915HMR5_ROMCU
MINFCGNATNTLSGMITIATQHPKILEVYKAEIEEMRVEKRELSKLNVPKIENIARPTSSNAQSLKSNKLKNAISNRKSQLNFQ